MSWSLEACFHVDLTVAFMELSIVFMEFFAVVLFVKDYSFEDLAKHILFKPTFVSGVKPSDLLVSPMTGSCIKEKDLSRSF